MPLKEQINQHLTEAMRKQAKLRMETLRGLKSAIHYAEIEAGVPLNDAAVEAVVQKQVKQRRDALAQYEAAGRTDLANKEAAELAILEDYLPQQLSEAEIEEQAKAVIAEVGATTPKDMGQVMKSLMAKLQGQADGKLVSQIVRQLLTPKGS